MLLIGLWRLVLPLARFLVWFAWLVLSLARFAVLLIGLLGGWCLPGTVCCWLVCLVGFVVGTVCCVAHWFAVGWLVVGRFVVLVILSLARFVVGWFAVGWFCR